jgi:hypothetical protein
LVERIAAMTRRRRRKAMIVAASSQTRCEMRSGQVR